MRRIFIYISLILLPIVSYGQNPNGNYNPYVNEGVISPSPLWPVEVGGEGVVSFNIGNSGSDPLEVYDDQYITLTITLSYGKYAGDDPISAVGGSFASNFSWSFNNNTYSGVQISTIAAGSVGTIEISYEVNQNSNKPGQNGFNVNISPAPYQTESNSMEDDAVSSYTHTEIRDYGDAPSVYGSAWHILDYENFLGTLVDGDLNDQSSESADGDDLNNEADEDGVTFPEVMQQGETVNLSIEVNGLGRINAWIDWNDDGDFDDENERIAENYARFAGLEDFALNIPRDASTNGPIIARFRFTPGTLDSSTGEAIGGEVEDYAITISSSISAPTVPEGLVASHISADSVVINWNESTDDVAVEAYRIYRNGSLLSTVSELSYSDKTVSLGNTYLYSVSALDNDGYESGLSDELRVDVGDTEAPTTPTDLGVNAITDTSVTISWQYSTDNVGVIAYLVYRDGVYLDRVVGFIYTDTTVVVGNTYYYSVSAIDEAENESERTGDVRVVVSNDDIEAPSVPANFSAELVSLHYIELDWDASVDNLSVTGYRIYRNNALLSTVQTLEYTDSMYISGYEYSYSVSAYDEAGNESARTASISINTPDVEPPSTPTGLMVVSVNAEGVKIAWNESVDNIAMSGYNIYRNNDFVTSLEDTVYTDNLVITGESYSYSVSSVDLVGNESEKSELLNITVSSNHFLFACEIAMNPNPSNGIFNICLAGIEGDYVFEIISPGGNLLVQEMLSLAETKSMQFNYPHLNPGLYNIRIYNESSIYYGKLVIIQ